MTLIKAAVCYESKSDLTIEEIRLSDPEQDEIRVTVRGAQCDLLPLTSETNVSIRGNDCSWNGNFQASLSIDYTLNGPFIIPSDQLDQIWCTLLVGTSHPYHTSS